MKFCARQKKKKLNFSDITLINKNGIEWVDKCKMGTYCGEEKAEHLNSSFDFSYAVQKNTWGSINGCTSS